MYDRKFHFLSYKKRRFDMEVTVEIRISVRGLVEFLLRSGDIDNRKKVSPEDAMSEGSRIHRMIQRRMGSGYHAEVSMK